MRWKSIEQARELDFLANGVGFIGRDRAVAIREYITSEHNMSLRDYEVTLERDFTYVPLDYEYGTGVPPKYEHFYQIAFRKLWNNVSSFKLVFLYRSNYLNW